MGLTYINETADRLQDELWHITVADRVPLYDPALTQFVCERCRVKLANREELENHQREEHSFKPPRLYFGDRIQPYLLTFRNQDEIKELHFENVETIKFLNGARWQSVSIEAIQNPEFWLNRNRLELKLVGKSLEETRHLLRFDTFNEKQIQATSKQFINRFAKKYSFTWDDVIDFERDDFGQKNCSYRKALANYLRGVLFRNKDFEAFDAKQESFKAVYNSAYSELRYHDDHLSRVLTAIINLTKSDFSVRRPTGVHQIDFLAALFFELTAFGDSQIKLSNNLDVGLPIAPTDKSCEMLLKSVEIDDPDVFEKHIEISRGDSVVFGNEINLAKILYLWVFSKERPRKFAAFKSDFVHNARFKKFIDLRSRDD